MRRIPLLFVSLLLSFIAFTQKAEENSTVSKELEEVVITAQYAPVSEKNAIHKVRVIDAKTIEAKASNNLRDLLSQELNIDLAQNSVFGSSIELQGVSKENVKVLIDGVPVIGRLDGIIDFGQINMSNIERIEIVEGPTSVFYGTDAIGGIINIITKKNQRKTLEGNVSLYYESINAADIKGKIGYKFGKNTIQIDGGNYYFDGLSTKEATRNLNWEKKNQSHLNFLYKRRFSKLEFTYNSKFFKEKLQYLGEITDKKIQDKDYYTQRINNSLNLQGEIFKDKFLMMNLAFLDYQRFHNTFDVDPVSFETTAALNDNGSDNLVHFKFGELRTQLGHNKLEDKIKYAFGIDLTYESTNGERILDKEQSIQTYAGFGSLNYLLGGSFEMQAAARYTLNSTYGSLISPALNLKYIIGENSILRFSYARGFRAPSLKELFLDFHIKNGPFTFIITGNEALEVEKSHSFNLFFSHEIHLSKTRSLMIEPSVFYNNISNLIALSEMQDFKRHYININKFKSIGGKLDVSFSFNKSLKLSTGIAIVGRNNEYSDTIGAKEYLFSPDISSSIGYHINKIGTDLFLSYKYTGKRPGYYLNEENVLVETIRKDYNNMDFSVSKSFHNQRIISSMGVKNIFNVTDIESINQVGEAHARDMQLWGRSFFIKILINF
jgi:outer membrane receptor for ferrienterochelin and colicins